MSTLAAFRTVPFAQRKTINQIVSHPDCRAYAASKLWANVNVRGSDECWEWTGRNRCDGGYGRITLGRANLIRAHRLSYALTHGAVPDGLHVCHSCDNPGCVNPKHLYLGTDSDNLADMRRKGRGHPPPKFYGEEHHNTKFSADVARIIRASTVPAVILAERYGVSRKTIYRIRSGQSWQELR